MKRVYGWRHQLPDHRDILFKLEPPEVLPDTVDLRDECPAVYDQKNLGSCTANAIAGAYEFDVLKQGLVDFIPSRLFIYYNERASEGTIKSDAGAVIRDGIKSVAKLGVCSESLWPYYPTSFMTQPPSSCYDAAASHKILEYAALPVSITALKMCLAMGVPFVFGFTVYESFESEEVAKTGMLSVPGVSESTLGGHAVMAVGYQNSEERFIVRNSWGSEWGDKGYFTMPYQYFNLGLCSDIWTLKTVQ